LSFFFVLFLSLSSLCLLIYYLKSLRRSQADRFQRTGAALRRKMWWNNVKMWALVGGLLACLALVIFLSVCFSGGGNCFKKKQ